jgi:hypothetical protein
VRHCLIADPAERTIVNHARHAESAIATDVYNASTLRLGANGRTFASPALLPKS